MLFSPVMSIVQIVYMGKIFLQHQLRAFSQFHTNFDFLKLCSLTLLVDYF